MNITIAGAGYVGLSLGVLLAQHNRVTLVTTKALKAEQINHRHCPFRDECIEAFLTEKSLNLIATTEREGAYQNADLIIVAVPTDYDSEKGKLDTSAVEDVISRILKVNPEVTVVVKSTVPIGYTRELCQRTGKRNILVSPEFLREGRALYDNLHPSRIVVGADMDDPVLASAARRFAALLIEGAEDKDVHTLFMGTTEAEAVKLFANTYLAMRIGFFNELDSFAESNGLDARTVIEGICHDSRIGNYYNNPSFG